MNATSTIREHMEVIGADGGHVGTVDHVEPGNRIKLTKSDSADGHHHFIPVDWVDHVDEHVHLSISTEEARDEWEEGEMEMTDDDASTSMSDEDSDEDQQR